MIDDPEDDRYIEVRLGLLHAILTTFDTLSDVHGRYLQQVALLINAGIASDHDGLGAAILQLRQGLEEAMAWQLSTRAAHQGWRQNLDQAVARLALRDLDPVRATHH
jgi:hypothetical protein